MSQLLQQTSKGAKKLTCCPAKVGPAVSHVEIDRATALPICQDLREAIRKYLCAGVGHLFTPMHQPSWAALHART